MTVGAVKVMAATGFELVDITGRVISAELCAVTTNGDVNVDVTVSTRYVDSSEGLIAGIIIVLKIEVSGEF